MAIDHVAGFVNARGAVPVIRLHDISNRVREVALHGVHHGAAMALAAIQVYSNHDLRLLPHEALVTRYPGDYERLVEDFSDAANSVALTSQADDIVHKVFSGLYLVISDIKQTIPSSLMIFLLLHAPLCPCLSRSCR